MNHRDTDPRHDAEEKLRRDVALFRYGVIADLAQLPPGTSGIRERLRAKAKHSYTIPGTLRTPTRAPSSNSTKAHAGRRHEKNPRRVAPPRVKVRARKRLVLGCP